MISYQELTIEGLEAIRTKPSLLIIIAPADEGIYVEVFNLN
jgi:hypothetical protein